MRSSKHDGAPEAQKAAQTPRGRKILGNVLKVLLFVAIAVGLNVLITLCLEPYGTAAEVTWRDYHQSANEKIDTVIVGSSYAQRNIDPFTLDETLGSNSFSLATPAQSLGNALASIQAAKRDHNISRAILFAGPETFQNEPWFNAQVTFMQAKSLGEPVPEVLKNVGRLALDEVNVTSSKSITWMFPWFYSTVSFDPQAISENIQRRLTYPNPIDTAGLVDPTWHYMGKGHGGYEGDFTSNILWDHEIHFTSDAKFLPKNMSDFDKLLTYCEQNDIQLYVGIAPRPDLTNLKHKDDEYRELMAGLEQFVTERGGVYYDFNLTHPDFYRAEEDEYSDSEHLDIEGSAHLSRALGMLIAQDEAKPGSSAEQFFGYDEWDTYLASYNSVEYCYFTYKVNYETGYVDIKAHSIAQPNTEIEYKFDVENPVAGRMENVRPYSTETEYHYPMMGERGDVRLYLSARPVGSNEKAAYTFHADIFYW